MNKIANSCIWGLTMRPLWTNESVGQSAQIVQILPFNNIFLYKIKFQREYLYEKIAISCN